MPIDKMRDNLWALGVQVPTSTDQHVYSIQYGSFAQAAANAPADYTRCDGARLGVLGDQGCARQLCGG
jgi:hypothetical protein